MEKNKTNTGKFFEQVAIKFLQEKHFEILKTNFRFGKGEIESVAKDNSALVFIEVKARSSNLFGTPEESITTKKQKILKKTAEGFIFKNPELKFEECRFDVIAIYFSKNESKILHHIEAF